MSLFFMLIAGLLFGLGIAQILFLRKKDDPVGALRVDQSDPDGPYIFLELYESVEDLSKRKEAIVEVKIQDYVSHE